MLGYIRSRTNKGDGYERGASAASCHVLNHLWLTRKEANARKAEGRGSWRQAGSRRQSQGQWRDWLRPEFALSALKAQQRKTNNKERERESGTRNICSTVANVQIFSLFAFRKLNFFGDIFLWLFTFHFPHFAFYLCFVWTLHINCHFSCPNRRTRSGRRGGKQGEKHLNLFCISFWRGSGDLIQSVIWISE